MAEDRRLGNFWPRGAIEMPRGPQGEKRPADVVGNAVRVMRIATGEETDDTDSVKSEITVTVYSIASSASGAGSSLAGHGLRPRLRPAGYYVNCHRNPPP
jgi:hypothetical protein